MPEIKIERNQVYNWIIINHLTGEVKCLGVDFSNGNKPIYIVEQTNDILVVKIPSGTYWRSLGGDRGYAEARFMVYAILDRDENVIRTVCLVEVPVRATHRK